MFNKVCEYHNPDNSGAHRSTEILQPCANVEFNSHLELKTNSKATYRRTHVSLGSSRSGGNTGSARSSSTAAGSTDSSIWRREWGAGGRRGWWTEQWANLEPVRRKHPWLVSPQRRSEKLFRRDLLYTMSLTSWSESPVVSPVASMVQKYTPLSHHITSVMARSASVGRQHHVRVVERAVPHDGGSKRTV